MNKTSFSLLFLLVFLTSCGNNVSPVDSGLENQIFHFGNGSEPQGLDPHIVTGVPEHHILIALCEGLTSSNLKVELHYLEWLSHGVLVMMEKLIHLTLTKMLDGPMEIKLQLMILYGHGIEFLHQA